MAAEDESALRVGQMVRSLVSVVVPTYNRASLIAEALDSVAQQTHRPIELLIVDDGSTDDTAEVVTAWRQRHAAGDLAVHYQRQRRAGASAARNRALRQCSGEYVQFLDSDDLLTPTKLKRSIEAMGQAGASVAVMDAQRFADGEARSPRPTRFSQRRPRNVLGHARKGLMNTPTPLYRREAVAAMGPWREDLAAWQDFEFTFRAFALALSMEWLDEVGVLIRNTPGSIIRMNPDETYTSYLRACEHIEQTAAAHGKCDRKLRAALGRRLSKRCWVAFQRGAPTAGQAFYRAALPRLGRLRRYEAMLQYAVNGDRRRSRDAAVAVE